MTSEIDPITHAVVTPPVPVRPGADRLRYITPAALAAFITLLALAPMAYALWRHLPPPVVVIDVQKIIEEDQSALIASIPKDGKLSDDQRTRLRDHTTEFGKRLSIAVEDLGQECQCVLLNKAALLGGMATDYTDQLRDRLKH